MAYLIFVLVSLGLLAGFFALTSYEARRDARFYASQRDRLDHTVERAIFVSEHVNFGEFLRDEVRHLTSRIGHSVAHVSLIVVRVVERLLTRLVRRMRANPEIDTAPRETAREFVKTLSDFKGNLKAEHPKISEE